PGLPGCRLRPSEKVEVAAAQGNQLVGRRRFAAYHPQAAGDVVDTVAVLVPGHDPMGALEYADVIGQPLKVAERRGRAGRDLHETPEAGSNGLACPPTSRAAAEHPPRPRVVNAQSRYPELGGMWVGPHAVRRSPAVPDFYSAERAVRTPLRTARAPPAPRHD